MTRRGVMKGVGGLAALSMSNTTVAQAKEVLAGPLPTDPHTRETYRSIVDAIVPRTPELEDEFGAEHVPGGLDVELEKFIIWDFNHFQEVRLETLTAAAEANGLSAPEAPGGGGTPEPPGGVPEPPGGIPDLPGTGEPPEPPAGRMPVSLFEFGFDGTGSASDLDALADATGADLAALNAALDVPLGAVRDELTFGGIDRFEVSLADELGPNAQGPASFDVVIERGSEVFRETYGDYPYAVLFPMAFDVLAAEFIAAGRNEDAIERGNQQFAGGGTFVQLSREDRLRCLWDIVEEGSVDTLDGVLSPMLPAAGILKFVVMAVNGLHGFGYYTEWSGYADTKTAEPSNRVLDTPQEEIQSRVQTGYPGPADGYAADWRHAIDPRFEDGSYNIESNRDPFIVTFDLPEDLRGEDVIEGIGGDR